MERERRAMEHGQEARGGQVKRWRAEFPYHWDSDELVSRREMLQFAVYTSGALFAGTAVLAALGLLRKPPRYEPREIPRAAELREGRALYFRYPGPEDEAMLLRLPGGEYVAYSQTCTHLSCSVYYQPERERLFCPCHDGVFSPETGDPVAGPPVRALPRILIERRGGAVYAVGVEL